jgi:hypothetical protein
MKPHQEDFKRSMFDIKIDLDEISLNMNRDQVKFSKKKYIYIYDFESFSIRIYSIYLNFKIFLALNPNI